MDKASVPYGYCHCGCGERTNLSTVTRAKDGLVKGEPRRYLRGHQSRTVNAGHTRQQHPADSKACNMCGQWKPYSEFHRNPRSLDGVAYACKECARAKTQKWRDDNPGLQAEREREKLKDPEYRKHKNQKQRESRERNKEKANARNREWQAANKDYLRQYRQSRREIDRERERARRQSESYKAEARERTKRWYADNAERAREYQQQYKALHPDWVAHWSRVRRARVLEAPGEIRAEQWRALQQRYDYRCLACGEQKPLTMDHVQPITKGGAHDITNIQPLCQSCNSSKSTHAIDYRPQWSAYE